MPSIGRWGNGLAVTLSQHDGDDLRDLPLIERKRRLKKLLGGAKRRAIQFVEHLPLFSSTRSARR
jgi:ATP-dependent DNA ligase